MHNELHRQAELVSASPAKNLLIRGLRVKLAMTGFVIICLLLSVGCKRRYEENIARVSETKFVHWGRGYYKLRVFYEFEDNDSIYKRDNFTKGLYASIYVRKRYKEGDSVIIKYPKGKPNKSKLTNRKIVKKTK
jgi:hypothetical protein